MEFKSHGAGLVKRIPHCCENRLKTCYISGYPLDLLEQQGLLRQTDLKDPAVAFLQKPFTPACLCDLITGALASKGERESCARVTYAAAA